jgi:hypothetical protein
MSVIMMLHVDADPDKFEAHAQANQEQLTRITDDAKSKGAIHHFFAATDDQVVVIDEWPDEASFQGFFDGQTEIPELMQAVGATPAGPPTYFRKLDTGDEF